MKTTLPPSVEKHIRDIHFDLDPEVAERALHNDLPKLTERFEDYPDEDDDLPIGVTFITCLGVAVALILMAVIIFLVSLIW